MTHSSTAEARLKAGAHKLIVGVPEGALLTPSEAGRILKSFEKLVARGPAAIREIPIVLVNGDRVRFRSEDIRNFINKEWGVATLYRPL